MISVRPAHIRDLGTVLDWLNKEDIWRLDSPEPYTRRTRQQFAPQWQTLVDGGTAFIIEFRGRPVGHMGWVRHTEELGEFYIVIGETDAWGLGIGRSAMEALFRLAAGRGLAGLFGRVLGNNPRALAFFRKMGFTPCGHTRNYFTRDQQSFDLHWVKRSLKPADPGPQLNAADPVGVELSEG